MCSLIILFRPTDDWPLILAANRDELASRPWRPPGRHWRERAQVVAGMDLLSGGSWMGLNDQGVAACILNRVGTLGPADGKRSRGELVLEALDHATAGEAAAALAHLEASSYRSFNLIVGDEEEVFWLRNLGGRSDRIEVIPVPPGFSMITAHDLNDESSPRIARFLPAFREALPPDPDGEDWSAWEALQAAGNPEDPAAGLCIDSGGDFGTVSAGHLALPRRPQTLDAPPRQAIWRFAAGRPDRHPFRPVDLDDV